MPEMRRALPAILERTDILIPSEGEITALTEPDDEAGAVAESLAAGVRAVVIKTRRRRMSLSPC